MSLGGDLAEINSIHCTIHRLQLVIEDAILSQRSIIDLLDRFRSRTSTSRRREWRDLARKYGVVFASGVVTVIFRTPKTIFHVVSRTSSCCFNFFFQKGTYIIRIVLIVLLVIILFILYICTHCVRFLCA